MTPAPPAHAFALPIAPSFRLPLAVLAGIAASLALGVAGLDTLAVGAVLFATVAGSYRLVLNTIQSLLRGHFALDYIAILAIAVALVTGEYLVAAVIALMVASGEALEDYGVSQAKRSLTALIDRIPREVTLWERGGPGSRMAIAAVAVGQEIFIRKGEVIPLDGVLVSDAALTDESSLTGEPYMMDKERGDLIRSGTINAGAPIAVRVTRREEDSTYRKIIEMVQQAQDEKAPLVRLADRYSAVFTAITLVIAAFAWIISGNDLTRVLAVLVIATPCPLILATPIALMGGVNAAARQRIIVKKLASIEVLSRARALVLDKTGTITLGRPRVTAVETAPGRDEDELLAAAEAIERNSLHPLAKAIVTAARERGVPLRRAEQVEERIGSGIFGTVEGHRYGLAKLEGGGGMAIEMTVGSQRAAVFRFEDEIKPDSREIVAELRRRGLDLYIFTGDRREAAEQVAAALGGNVTVRAECTPADKKEGIEALRRQGRTTAMVGDGINDAPALAYADVGMVFSNEEQTAASEAADVVFLGGEFALVRTALSIARRTVAIALQSIVWGIGLSVLGMVAAAVGLIPPLAGAALQEAIDVAVILNALRASR